jgi:hypothetical protein
MPADRPPAKPRDGHEVDSRQLRAQGRYLRPRASFQAAADPEGEIQYQHVRRAACVLVLAAHPGPLPEGRLACASGA